MGLSVPWRGGASRLLASAFLLSALILPALGETRFYASDESGYQGTEVQTGKAEGWVLEVRDDPKGQLRILEKDGAEVETTLIERLQAGRRESFSKGGKPLALREYDRSGALLLEKEYDEAKEGSSTEKRYSYKEGRLVSVEAFDTEGKTSGQAAYRYDPKGRLVELRLSGSLGTETLGALQGAFGPGVIYADDASTSTGLSLVVYYDEAMRPVVLESRRGGELRRRESLVYSPAGSIERRSIEDPKTGEKTENLYDQGGRLLSSTTVLSGKTLYSEEWSYDAKGRPTRKEVMAKGRVTLVSTEWKDQDGSRTETTTENGGLTLVVLTSSDGSSVKEYYDKGKLYLRATWMNGRLEKEEFMSEGKVLRTKVYP